MMSAQALTAPQDSVCVSGWKSGYLLELWAYRFLLAAFLSITFSIALGEAFLCLSFVLFLLSVIVRRHVPCLPRILIPALVFVCVAVAVSFFGVNRSLSLGKLPKLVWFLAIPVAATLISTAQRLVTLVKAFVLGCGVLSLESCVIKPVKAWFAIRAAEEAGEKVDWIWVLVDQGSMTDGQMLMLGVVAGLALAFAARAHGRSSVVWWVLTAFIALGLLLNFKRGSWACTIVIIALFLCGRLKWRYVLLLAVCVIVIGIGVRPVRERLWALRSEVCLAEGGRMQMWTKVAPALIRTHPWGIGYRALTNEMMREYAPDIEPYRDHLHSNVIQVLVATGWLGLAVYMVWMAWALVDGLVALVRAGRASRGTRVIFMALLLMLVGLLLNGLVEYNFGDAELMIVYAVLMGIMGCYRTRDIPDALPQGAG